MAKSYEKYIVETTETAPKSYEKYVVSPALDRTPSVKKTDPTFPSNGNQTARDADAKWILENEFRKAIRPDEKSVIQKEYVNRFGPAAWNQFATGIETEPSNLGSIASVPTEQTMLTEQDKYKPVYGDPIGSGILQGASLGWSDELMAKMYGGSDPEKYQRMLDVVRNENQLTKESSPGLYTLGELVGGFATGGLGKPIVGVGKNLLMSTATGAISGAGNADENTLRGAGVGATLGAILGTAAPIAGRLGIMAARPGVAKDTEILDAARKSGSPNYTTTNRFITQVEDFVKNPTGPSPLSDHDKARILSFMSHLTDKEKKELANGYGTSSSPFNAMLAMFRGDSSTLSKDTFTTGRNLGKELKSTYDDMYNQRTLPALGAMAGLVHGISTQNPVAAVAYPIVGAATQSIAKHYPNIARSIIPHTTAGGYALRNIVDANQQKVITPLNMTLNDLLMSQE